MKKIIFIIVIIITISFLSNWFISYASQLKINTGQLVLKNSSLNINPVLGGYPGTGWVKNQSGDGSTALNKTNCQNATGATASAGWSGSRTLTATEQ